MCSVLLCIWQEIHWDLYNKTRIDFDLFYHSNAGTEFCIYWINIGDARIPWAMIKLKKFEKPLEISKSPSQLVHNTVLYHKQSNYHIDRSPFGLNTSPERFSLTICRVQWKKKTHKTKRRLNMCKWTVWPRAFELAQFCCSYLENGWIKESYRVRSLDIYQRNQRLKIETDFA